MNNTFYQMEALKMYIDILFRARGKNQFCASWGCCGHTAKVKQQSRTITWLCLTFFLLPSALILAQDKPMKWGEVPRADLEMTEFPADSNAAAVILGDYGEVEFVGGEFEMVYRRHRRIKIISETGYQWGNFALQYYAKKNFQRVNDIEGQTIKLTADGAVRREKLDKKSIFDENVDGEWRRIRFTLPNLSPGAVVEYRFTVHSQDGTFLHDWEFQTGEPTRWSEFRADIPSVLQYVMLRPIGVAFAIEESKPHPIPAATLNTNVNLNAVTHRWAMRDIPALREEPFMTTPDDYRARIRFQLAKFVWPGQMPVAIMNTWEKLAEDLMDFESFGRQIESHGVLRRQAETLVAGISNPEEKLRAIYDYVRTTMNWNGEYGIYADVDLDKAFQARRAGGPEIALMLTGMLRAAGLEAHPVLVSTRDNGKPIDVYSILRQFNHVLTYAKIGQREYLLDATDQLCPHTLLPAHALNEKGWLVEKKNPRWINITTTGIFSNQTIVSAKLAPDGVLAGKFESSDAGYSGLRDRRTLRDKKEDDYIRDGWLSDLAGARLDSFKISFKDSTHKPLLTAAYFSSNDHVQVAGDNIYFNPIFFGRYDKNPFTLPERNFPVDFTYGRKLYYTLNLTLPEGYVVQELPRSITLNLPRDGGQFRRVAQVEGNTLQLMSQVTIRKPRFDPFEYKALREFYDRIVAAHAEQVVLKRAATSSTAKQE
jgi:transglutaminase-like putative cysteine protease